MTMLTKKEKSILEALSSPASEHGIEIVTVEIIGSSRSPVIRVYIDTEQGVSFTELSESQEWIGALLDEIDPFPGAYTLEVSSPGIDRPLRTPEHFSRYIGEDARIRTIAPLDDSSNFKGTLCAADDDSVTISIDGAERRIPFSDIKRANLIGKLDF